MRAAQDARTAHVGNRTFQRVPWPYAELNEDVWAGSQGDRVRCVHSVGVEVIVIRVTRLGLARRARGRCVGDHIYYSRRRPWLTTSPRRMHRQTCASVARARSLCTRFYDAVRLYVQSVEQNVLALLMQRGSHR